jgi:flagellar hook-basal body complex protein FliE
MRTAFISPPLAGSVKTESLLHQGPQKKASIGEDFKKALEEVESHQKEADSAVIKAAGGGSEQIHETMIKLEEAGVSMRLLLKVRSKALDAYQEIMRMQV